jgi:poly(3-hydroxyoctanoate) depolymerase
MVPLVFLPGAGGRLEFWRPVAECLGDLGPAVRFAWPGFGDVPPEPSIDSLDGLYRWMVARLPDGRCHVIAQSMGGVLAARLAIEQPERVASLVLCATSGGVDVAVLGGVDWRAAFRAELPRVPTWFESDRTDLRERLPEIQAPTLILYGDSDPVSPKAVAKLLCSLIPNARSQLLPNAGHDFANRLAAEVAAAIREHIQTRW